MFPSLGQIITAIDSLKGLHPFFGYAFFGFKCARIPVDDLVEFRYSELRETILEKYFRFDGIENKFFNPFDSPKQWVSDRYDSTSLQRVIADTFGDAFIRAPDSHEWGWHPSYVDILQNIMFERSSQIPLIDIAIWFYRNIDIQAANEEDYVEKIRQRLIEEFFLTSTEISELFIDIDVLREIDLVRSPISDREILSYIGVPSGFKKDLVTALTEVRVENVGPFRLVEYQPSSRLNIITGDNSFGKTFLLDVAWWALTGEWGESPAYPAPIRGRSSFELSFDMSISNDTHVRVPYDRVAKVWQRPDIVVDNVVVYFGYSGGVNIYIPHHLRDDIGAYQFRLGKEEIFQGRRYKDNFGREKQLCNGLVHDIVIWQLYGDRYKNRIDALQKVLRVLSPPEGSALRLGRPVRLDGDSRELPSIRLSYGEIPFVYLSAGIQKAVSLAYVLVWLFFEFLGDRKDEFNRIAILLDEIEAHLHPKWQRQILPALISSVKHVAPQAKLQLHIATHSPLVLASLETEYNPDIDRIHMLSQDKSGIDLNSIPFMKFGTFNDWLESDIFGLREARSSSAESVLERAKRLLADGQAADATLEKMTRELSLALPEDDPFWARWNRFLQFGKRSGQS